MLGIVPGDALTGLSSFLVPLARLTRNLWGCLRPRSPARRALNIAEALPASPTSAGFWNLARLGVVSVHTLAVVIQQSHVVHRLGSLKSILRTSEITEEELLETAFQPVTLSRFFGLYTLRASIVWHSRFSSRSESGEASSMDQRRCTSS